MELNLLNLLLVLFVAWGAGLLTSRLGYPAVLGELLVGILLGPPLLGLLDGGEALAVLAEIGVLLMMLYVGMEIDPAELGRASKGGILVAIGGFITPFVLCYLLVVYWAEMTPIAGVFVGVGAGVTSLITKSRILVDLRLLDTRIAHVMMAGALITDTMALVIFAAVIGIVEGGTGSAVELAAVAGKAVAYFAAAAFFGLKVLPSLMRRVGDMKALSGPTVFMALMLVMLVYAEVANLAGMHGILGAFLAGLFLRESVLGRTLSQELMHRVRDVSIGFLAPIFFVTAGFGVTLDVLRTDLGLLIGLIGLATVGKIIGTALFYLPTGYGWREGMVLGLGMNGRGAVEIILAQIALSIGLITTEVFSVLVFLAIATTALDPIALKWGVAWLRTRGELARSDEERHGILVVGADPAARQLARVLARGEGTRVTLLDANPEHVQIARREGLQAFHGNALDERDLAEAGAVHVRHLIAVTPNGEVNALVAQLGRAVFAIPEIHVMRANADATTQTALLRHLDATTLFGGPVRLGEWAYLVGQDRMRIQTIPLDDAERPKALFQRLQSEGALPIAVSRDGGHLPFHDGLVLQAGDQVVTLQALTSSEPPSDHIDDLVERATILDLTGPMSVADFMKRASRVLEPVVGLKPEAFMERMLSREAESSTVVLPGLAIPHLRVEGEGVLELLVARCREGIIFPGTGVDVVAVFTLVTSVDQRHMHLRALAAIAHLAQQPDFESRWLQAVDTEALRGLMTRADRRREPGLEPANNQPSPP